MQNIKIQKIVIVGGGTAGWMTAAALGNFFKGDPCTIELVESDSIATVGVGEATLPHLRHFNQTLGLDENEFMRRTNATYKLGIEFSHWGAVDDAYIHPFGHYGHNIHHTGFHHYWLKARQAGFTGSIDDYSLSVIAARRGNFAYPSNDLSDLSSSFSYAFHLDASQYAKYLREYSELKGVRRTEGKVTEVERDDAGLITTLVLDDGQKIEGDLFVDCSGFRALLIGDALGAEFEDWSHWLPCDRAVAVPTESKGEPLPFTKAIARDAGWQWRIPLQHRTGNGHVYCSQYMSDDEALNILVKNLEGAPLAEPNFLRFKAGHRQKTWDKNCIAIGLASGFLEPLESTSIYLIQIAITKLLEFFPSKSFSRSLVDGFNQEMRLEFERVRDFLILHYHATNRSDTEFWRYCRDMDIPQSLQDKMTLFKARGYVVEYEKGLFLEPSWVAVYLGQGIIPAAHDVRANKMHTQELTKYLQEMKSKTQRIAEKMPTHAQALAKNCSVENVGAVIPKASLSLYGSRR